MNDEPRVGDEHRRKVENFRLQIHGDGEEDRPEAISSYSDPREARRRASFPEGAALERARLAHTLRDREKGRKNRRFFRFIWLSMVLLVSLLLAKYAVSGVNDMMGVGRQNVTGRRLGLLQPEGARNGLVVSEPHRENVRPIFNGSYGELRGTFNSFLR